MNDKKKLPPEKREFILKPRDPNWSDVLDALIDYIKDYAEDFPLSLVVTHYKKDRSLLQNNFLHGWIFREQLMKKLFEAGIFVTLPDGTERPFSVDDLKDFFKMPFIIDQIHEPEYLFINGEELRREVHPSKWPSDKFAIYCQLICQFAAEIWSIEVEDPVNGYWLSIKEEMEKRR